MSDRVTYYVPHLIVIIYNEEIMARKSFLYDFIFSRVQLRNDSHSHYFENDFFFFTLPTRFYTLWQVVMQMRKFSNRYHRTTVLYSQFTYPTLASLLDVIAMCDSVILLNTGNSYIAEKASRT